MSTFVYITFLEPGALNKNRFSQECPSPNCFAHPRVCKCEVPVLLHLVPSRLQLIHMTLLWGANSAQQTKLSCILWLLLINIPSESPPSWLLSRTNHWTMMSSLASIYHREYFIGARVVNHPNYNNSQKNWIYFPFYSSQVHNWSNVISMLPRFFASSLFSKPHQRATTSFDRLGWITELLLSETEF